MCDSFQTTMPEKLINSFRNYLLIENNILHMIEYTISYRFISVCVRIPNIPGYIPNPTTGSSAVNVFPANHWDVSILVLWHLVWYK